MAQQHRYAPVKVSFCIGIAEYRHSIPGPVAIYCFVSGSHIAHDFCSLNFFLSLVRKHSIWLVF